MKRRLALAGIATALLGFYGPWVTSARGVAALTYNAIDLAEFCKFVVRAGGGPITREWFLVPVTAAALLLALWANSPSPTPFALRAPPLPPNTGSGKGNSWLRYALTLLAAGLSLVPLPPFLSGMSPSEFLMLMAVRSPEDRGFFWLGLAGLISILALLALGRRVTGRGRSALVIVLALFGALPAAIEFVARALPAISRVYGSPAVPAWGFFVMGVGFGLVALSSVMRET